MDEADKAKDGEISLFDLFEKALQAWRTILTFIAIGIAAATVVIFITPQQFEAIAIVQPGLSAGKPVEDLSVMIERVKSMPFQLRLARALGDVKWEARLVKGDSARNVITATARKGAVPLIELRAQDEVKEAAIKKLEIAILELQKAYSDIIQPSLTKQQAYLVVMQEKLVKAEKEIDDLSRLIIATSVRDDRFSQMSLMTSLHANKLNEVSGMRKSIAELELSLLPPMTQSVKTLEDIVVPEKPVSPKFSLVYALGVVGGGLAGIIWVFVAGARRRALR